MGLRNIDQMRCPPFSLVAFLVALLVTDAPAEASDAYKCKKKDGKVTFQDSPCQEDLEEKARQREETARQRREASARFNEKVKEQNKNISEAPNRAIHKELLKQAGLSAQKEGVCKVALSKVNANSPSDYSLSGMSSNQLSFTSTRGFRYTCEIDGLAIRLSSADWGRIQPKGNVTLEGRCARLTLYDPGLMITHDGSYCSQ